ncbi:MULTISPECIES: SPW repeat domain-containing protein [Bradyrhizobium]|uniref:SPW repeat domain-containing protein n=1 Tax=Bradyrhizobium TaxID=374 RepID=UPI001BAAACA9|nr:SPW repeat protein [Bradyrhizobium liaoningense]MBR0986610.1 SPW repeat protein [Bradyrhizobium liaoningense]GMO28842.1 SPW repeat protein [Bradyrhizobium sp. TM233]GMP02937.1 SPW repeat protein [Bradyrhizobium sp. TM239]
MSDFGFLKTHRTWEDWCGMLLGALIVASPWFPIQDQAAITGNQTVVLNAVTIGLVVFGISQLEYVALQRWQEVTTILVGLWLIGSPYALGYSGDGFLRIYHTSLGAVLVLLGVLQLWQDWDLNDQDMLRHG